MNEFNKLVEVYAPGFSGRRGFAKGDIVKLPIGWQKDRGYFADWAQDVTHGEVWGHVIDRNIHMTGDIEVTLLDPQTKEPLGQGLAFRPDELTLAEATQVNETTSPFPSIRNNIWDWEWDTSDYTTEASMLRNNTLDPWNRPLPHRSEWEIKHDREGDVLYWKTTTTVSRKPVTLIIFND